MSDKIQLVFETFKHLSLVEKIDQLFVMLKQLVLACVPEALQPLVSGLLSVVLVLSVFPGVFAIITVIERKGLGRIQNRYGPNRVGIPLSLIHI